MIKNKSMDVEVVLQMAVWHASTANGSGACLTTNVEVVLQMAMEDASGTANGSGTCLTTNVEVVVEVQWIIMRLSKTTSNTTPTTTKTRNKHFHGRGSVTAIGSLACKWYCKWQWGMLDNKRGSGSASAMDPDEAHKDDIKHNTKNNRDMCKNTSLDVEVLLQLAVWHSSGTANGSGTCLATNVEVVLQMGVGHASGTATGSGA
jgi:hypothetical protein